MKIRLILLFILIAISTKGQNDSLKVKDERDYQIHLSNPAKVIRYIMYDKDFTPIQGRISEDRKSIIIKNYKSGSKVRLKVEYEDGTMEEILRSPCFIDPVIGKIEWMNESKFHFEKSELVHYRSKQIKLL